MRIFGLVVGLLCATLAAGAQAKSFWAPKTPTPPGPAEELLLGADRELDLARRYAKASDLVGAKQHAEKALHQYEGALRLSPANADAHYRAYLAATYKPEDWEAVIRHIDGLRVADPKDPRERELTWTVCIALSKVGADRSGSDADLLFSRAIQEYEHWRALVDENDPQFARDLSTGYSNAGELLMALGRLDESLAYYQLGIELNAAEPLSYYGAAVAYDRDGQWSNAEQSMRRAVEIDPSLARLTQGDPGGDKHVFFVPTGDYFYYVGLAYQVQGKIPEALEGYRQFLRLQPSSRHVQRAVEHVTELEPRAPRR
jgi:tetratricopeptide (TPR) repeat protein